VQIMAVLQCDFFSDVLALNTSMTVILPQPTTTQIGLTGSAGAAGAGGPPVLYLLHGLSDDHTIWLRYTSIERYVADLGLAVIMPQVHRSFYTDEVFGRPYWTFVSEELPEIAGRFFRLSTRREDTFVAGLSMGGYGALKLALRRPERFAAAASLSGAVDLAARATGAPRPEDPLMMRRILGDRAPARTHDDLFSLVETVDGAPPLFVCCGTEDALHAENLRFRDHCAAHGLTVTATFDAGAHDWAYWDAKIRDVLAWLPLEA
jgi:putative tributyrin esterase